MSFNTNQVATTYAYAAPVATSYHGAFEPGFVSKLNRAWDAYNGRYAKPLRVRPNAPDFNVLVNYSRMIVDKSVSFLFGRPVTFNLDDEETRSPDEKLLDDIFRFNQKDTLFQSLAHNGSIFGHFFLKIHMGKPYPKLLVIDPRRVTVITAHDDYTNVLMYIIAWDVEDPKNMTRKIAYRQRIVALPEETIFDENGIVQGFTPKRWKIEDQQASARWSIGVVDERTWTTSSEEIWPYEFPPIVDSQNMPSPNTYWGQSDIEPDIINLIESSNRVVSNLNKTIHNHANPLTWTAGLSPEQAKVIARDSDGVIHLPGDPQMNTIQNLEMKSDMSSTLNMYDSLKEAIYIVSRTPEVASGKVQDLSYLSAMAMQILYGPMLEKVNTKQMTYGYFLIELCRRLLELSGRGPEHYVDIVWPETFPRDAQVESLTAVNKLQLGFSKDTLISELGGNPEYERERRKDDQEEEAKQAKALAEAAPKPVGASSGSSGSGGNTQPRVTNRPNPTG